MSSSELTRQYTTTLLLAVLVVAVLALLVAVDWRQPPAAEDGGRKLCLPGFTAENIAYLSIEHAGLTAELVRQKTRWQLISPVKWNADTAQVNRLLAGLEALPVLDVITAAQRDARALTMADYGLDEPRFRLIFGATAQPRHALAVGHQTPFGDALYLRVEGHDDVIVTATNLLEVLPANLENLRDRRLLDSLPMAINRVEIKSGRAAAITVARDGNDWFIQRPVVARADQQKVQELLERLHAFRIISFAAETIADPVAYGLNDDEAALQVNLWTADSDYPRKIVFGKPTADGTQLFARRADADAVFTVARTNLDLLPAQLSILREARLYCMKPEKVVALAITAQEQSLQIQKAASGWLITAPIQAPADSRAVNNLLHHLNNLRIERFIEASDEIAEALTKKPDGIMRFWDNLPAATAATQTVTAAGASEYVSAGGRILRIFAPSNLPDTVFAKFDDDQQVVALSPTAVAAISCDPADYRETAILALARQNIQAISCSAGEQICTVERQTAGTWRCITATNTPPLELIEQLLSLAEDLRVMRFERGQPADPAMYGLDAPQLTLTFTLTGTEGLRKTIAFGRPADEKGVFAALQGQPGVFVLSNEIVKLCRAFLSAASGRPKS